MSGQVSSVFSRNSSLRDARYAKKRIFGLDNTETELEPRNQNTAGTNTAPEDDRAREDSANVSRCQRISVYTKVCRGVRPVWAG